MSALIAWALGLSGFAALAMTMERHAQATLRRANPARRLMIRAIGVLLLAAALVACRGRWSWSIAITAWLGALTFGALGVAFILTYLPRGLVPTAMAAFVGAILAWGLST
jgi:hypothetical protein